VRTYQAPGLPLPPRIQTRPRLPKPYGVEAIHPDDFLVDLLDLASGAIASVVVEQAAGLKHRRGPSRIYSTRRDQGLV
jgi:hypothetical protein